MSQAVARLVVQPENNRIAVIVVGIIIVVVGTIANHGKCIRQFVLLVAKKRLYHSNLQAIDRYIAVNVTNPANVATGKISRDLLRKNPKKISFVSTQSGYRASPKVMLKHTKFLVYDKDENGNLIIIMIRRRFS